MNPQSPQSQRNQEPFLLFLQGSRVCHHLRLLLPYRSSHIASGQQGFVDHHLEKNIEEDYLDLIRCITYWCTKNLCKGTN